MRQEGSDLTITPTREDGLTIGLEENAVALEAWNLNSEKFLSSLCVPHSNIVQGAGGEEFRVTSWEGNVVDLLIMAGVSQFWGDVISVAPVDGSLGGSAEEVSGISSEGDGCNGSHNLSLFLNQHVLRSALGDSTVSRSEEEVSVG